MIPAEERRFIDGIRALNDGDQDAAVAALEEARDLPDAAWMPEIEAARQEYKLLAQTSTDSAFAARCADDLESAIRLARTDPAELYGLPIPSQ